MSIQIDVFIVTDLSMFCSPVSRSLPSCSREPRCSNISLRYPYPRVTPRQWCPRKPSSINGKPIPPPCSHLNIPTDIP